MFLLALLLAAAPGQIVLHCRAEGADLLATKEFTLIESKGQVRYPDATGIVETGAAFSADAVTFRDAWAAPLEGSYVIDRRSLSFRRQVTHNGKIVMSEQGSCNIHTPPPAVPESMQGAGHRKRDSAGDRGRSSEDSSQAGKVALATPLAAMRLPAPHTLLASLHRRVTDAARWATIGKRERVVPRVWASLSSWRIACPDPTRFLPSPPSRSAWS